MAITLVTMGSVASPPTLANSNTLRANMAKLEIQPNKYLKAISIVALTYVTANIAYKTDFAKLRTDSANLFRGITLLPDSGGGNQDLVIQTVLAWQTGKTASATLSGDVNTLLNTGRSLLEMSEVELDKALYLLQWKMSV